ncbi:uncharacterized protein K444DRAFT_715841 [Hyaloscypha bicolor E]|uniref:DUF6604 domain-containing protein n=1 Tax=Hyaloscypha bicolor E TaxID=1095630 RepID=A0A2J6TK91_9HELO|nr:uncharacterized protein K444DRAFT_715841 [Hyaloscypha bicolor E]PMD63439.1 hypothetical protein K444DRAFT_715841 [Hyaloscypha bicolor E]
MLPEFLPDSYSRYKEDTNVFATWLTNTAKACGHTSRDTTQIASSDPMNEAPASVRLKGNARKEAKANESSRPLPVVLPSTKHTLSTGDIITQAGIIAIHKKPAIKVPLVIQGVLRRAIRARKRCTLWFQNMTSESNKEEYEASNSSHQHFIHVLERALEILEPCFEKCKPAASKAKQPGSADNHQVPELSSSISNRFENLEVEDTADQNLDINGSEAAVSTMPTTKLPQNKNKVVTIYELERSMEVDLQFRVYCFFEDLHRVREFLIQTWQRFADGKIDLVTASLVTNVTLALVRESEERMKHSSPKLDHEDSYNSIASVIHPVPDIADSREGIRAMLQSTTLDKLVFRSTFVSMLKTIELLDRDKKKISPSSMIPISHLYLITATVLPKGYENVVADDHFLTLFLLDSMDLVIMGLMEKRDQEARRAGRIAPLPSYVPPTAFLDEITKGLTSAMFTGNITVTSAFQSRLLVDMQNILGDRIEQAYKQLRHQGAASLAALGNKWKPGSCMEPPMPEGNPQQWISDWGSVEASKKAILVSLAVHSVVKENLMVGYKQAKMALYESDEQDEIFSANGPLSFLGGMSTGLERIQSSSDPAFLHNHNPVYCGLEKLNILTAMENVGVDLSNYLCSLAPMAHLYNALRQTGLLTVSWPALDEAIELNMSLLFNGTLPTTAHQINSRYLLCMKCPVTAFARNHRGQKPDWQAVMKKLDFAHASAESSKHLRAYLDGTDSPEKFLHSMVKESRHTPSKRGRATSQLEMLTQLRDFLPQCVARLEVDRVTLSRQCARLFRLIRSAFKTRLGIEHVKEGVEFGEAFGKWNYITVMLAFDEAFPPRHSRPPTQHQVDGESQLAIAAEVTRNFISEVKSEPPIQPFDVVAATDRERSHYENLQMPRSTQRFMERL